MNNLRLAEIVPPLLRWYDSHARILPWRENPESYAVWISEIMLQQTRVEAVKPYFERWMKALPDLFSLAAASEAEVLKLWEGLGYYSRVRNIHRTAKLVVEQYGGSLPSTFEGLRSLPGVGEYTAGAVGSIAFQLPVPCVDGNVLRVVSRLTAEKADIGNASTKKLMTEWIREIIPYDRPGDFNQAMMELGATVCLPNGAPKCESCPAASLCEARIQNRVEEFPVKSGKPPRKIERKTVLVLLEGTETAGALSGSTPGTAVSGITPVAVFRTALRKRPDTGLLAGLWEFPNYEGTLTEDEVLQILKSTGLSTSSLIKLKKAKHIFTHIEWEMTGYLAFVEKAPGIQAPEFKWVSIGQLEEELTLPAAFKAYY
ncbi:MAG TPA: A/G-specific adenine glycosylase, partial [Anaerovoracaceae bacterium]|nr:A/G-specific adenine glycosylase [Anaerovoracaceae bacterium]